MKVMMMEKIDAGCSAASANPAHPAAMKAAMTDSVFEAEPLLSV